MPDEHCCVTTVEENEIRQPVAGNIADRCREVACRRLFVVDAILLSVVINGRTAEVVGLYTSDENPAVPPVEGDGVVSEREGVYPAIAIPVEGVSL